MKSTLRSLTQRPLFAGTVIVTLAFATGLVAAILGLLQEVFVCPLPTAEPGRLAVINSTYPERGWDRASASVPELLDLAARGSLFESVQVFAAFLIRSSGDPAAIIRAVRERIARIDPTLAVVEAQTMRTRLATHERPQRFSAGVFAVYGALATFLAALGVYGVLAFSVAQRTREFGVRLAVGASPGQIVSRALVKGLRWIGLGLAGGMMVAWLAGSLAEKLVVGITPQDPVVFTLVPALVLVVGLVAWLVPAIRASRSDPLVALRAE